MEYIGVAGEPAGPLEELQEFLMDHIPSFGYSPIWGLRPREARSK